MSCVSLPRLLNTIKRKATYNEGNTSTTAIMPEEFEIVPDEEYRKGDYIMVSVGEGKLVLGIESDGYTHS